MYMCVGIAEWITRKKSSLEECMEGETFTFCEMTYCANIEGGKQSGWGIR